VKPEREMPGISGQARVDVARVVTRPRGATAQPLEQQQGDPVDDQEGGGSLGGGEQFAQRVLQQQPDHADRDRAGDKQPAEPRVAVVLTDLAHLQRAPQPPDDPHPVLQEQQQQHDRRRQVRGDQERQEELVVLVDVPAGQPRQHDAVPEARNRKRLGNSLGEAEDDCLEVGDRILHGSTAYGSRWSERRSEDALPAPT
jgi:hypothetical protein